MGNYEHLMGFVTDSGLILSRYDLVSFTKLAITVDKGKVAEPGVAGPTASLLPPPPHATRNPEIITPDKKRLLDSDRKTNVMKDHLKFVPFYLNP